MSRFAANGSVARSLGLALACGVGLLVSCGPVAIGVAVGSNSSAGGSVETVGSRLVNRDSDRGAGSPEGRLRFLSKIESLTNNEDCDTWNVDAVRVALRPNVAIRFWRDRGELSLAASTRSRGERYLAFVLTSDDLALLDLGSAERVDDAIDTWRRAILGNSHLVRNAGDSVRSLVVEPIIRYLGDAPGIVVVADGAIESLPLDAIPFRDGCFGDYYRVRVVDSLLGAAAAKSYPKSVLPGLVAFGGGGEGVAPSGISWGGGSVPRTGRLSRLPGATLEVRQVAEAFSAAFPEARITSMFGENASESALNELASGATFIHLATHGIVRPESEGASLSGLALGRGPSGTSDGLLTPEEISALELTRCELVVLSACQSGPGHGARSLSRAFHSAGARAVLSSLWQVRDSAATVLMREFYRNLWWNSMDPESALWRAKCAARQQRFPIRDWAGWVLTSEP